MSRTPIDADFPTRNSRFNARQELRMANLFARIRYREQMHQISLKELSQRRKEIEERLAASEENRLAQKAFEKVLLRQPAVHAEDGSHAGENNGNHLGIARKKKRRRLGPRLDRR